MQQPQRAAVTRVGLLGDRVRAQPRRGVSQEPLERRDPNRAAATASPRCRCRPLPPRARHAAPTSCAASTDSAVRLPVAGPGGVADGVARPRAVRRRRNRGVVPPAVIAGAWPPVRGAASSALAASKALISAAIAARRLSMAATSSAMSGMRRGYERPRLHASSATRTPRTRTAPAPNPIPTNGACQRAPARPPVRRNQGWPATYRIRALPTQPDPRLAPRTSAQATELTRTDPAIRPTSAAGSRGEGELSGGLSTLQSARAPLILVRCLSSFPGSLAEFKVRRTRATPLRC